MAHDYSEQFAHLSDHYAALLAEHGVSPAAVQWSNADTQQQRLRILTEIADLQSAEILDFGCGTGSLLALLQRDLDYRGVYTGFDICAQMIEACRQQYPEHEFRHVDILAQPPQQQFDYVLASGVFNNAGDDNWGMMTTLLRELFRLSRRGLAFNCLSTYVDYRDEGLFYVEPEKVFAFCKQALSPSVTLRHDYRVKPGVIPFEFTVYVRRD